MKNQSYSKLPMFFYNYTDHECLFYHHPNLKVHPEAAYSSIQANFNLYVDTAAMHCTNFVSMKRTTILIKIVFFYRRPNFFPFASWDLMMAGQTEII